MKEFLEFLNLYSPIKFYDHSYNLATNLHEFFAKEENGKSYFFQISDEVVLDTGMWGNAKEMILYELKWRRG